MSDTRAQDAQEWIFERLKQVDSIRLFPNAARGGEFWWPDSYKPSIVLTRRGAKRQEPGAEIVITESIATTGYPKREFSTDHIAADVYYASVKQGDTLTPGLVLKFIDKDSRLVSAAFVDDFVLEAEHHNTAKDVQGSALPHFAGLFRSGSLYCLVFEDAGRDLTDEEYASKAVRDEAEQALRSIQTTGVSPHIAERSVRRGHDGKIKISSLWASETPYTPEEGDEVRSELSDFADKTDEELWEGACQASIYRLYGEFKVPRR